ncbi:hypothetical protein LCGC14_2699560 [marine sediment metagenome]|uniref:Uncharacterized protein n=1 Tax=marine sediment metagenome TaxID=412755 RepID=A0A0F9BQG5_9ZZZZ
MSVINSRIRIYLKGKADLLALDKMDSFDLDRYKKLNRESEELKHILDRSICMCPVCHRSNRDMIFNPVTKVWFCIDCYELNREYYKHTKDGKFYP